MIDSRFPISVEEVISSGLMAIGRLEADERRTAVDEILRMVELSDHRRASIGNLSGGQLQRALLGRALISRPEMLVLDEPSAISTSISSNISIRFSRRWPLIPQSYS